MKQYLEIKPKGEGIELAEKLINASRERLELEDLKRRNKYKGKYIKISEKGRLSVEKDKGLSKGEWATLKKRLKPKQKKDRIYSAIGKLKQRFGFKGTAKSKRLTKKSKLALKIPIKKGEKILNQRSKFFKEEYEKEKALLAWD